MTSGFFLLNAFIKPVKINFYALLLWSIKCIIMRVKVNLDDVRVILQHETCKSCLNDFCTYCTTYSDWPK